MRKRKEKKIEWINEKPPRHEKKDWKNAKYFKVIRKTIYS